MTGTVDEICQVIRATISTRAKIPSQENLTTRAYHAASDWPKKYTPNTPQHGYRR